MIEVRTIKDSQLKIIKGQLYGQYFKIFADSMRAAAAENGANCIISGRLFAEFFNHDTLLIHNYPAEIDPFPERTDINVKLLPGNNTPEFLNRHSSS